MKTAPETDDLASIFDAAPGKPVERVDRSTAQRYQLCPQQGYAVEAGLCMTDSTPASAGQAVHDAIAYATRLVHDGSVTKAGDVADAIVQGVINSRPDVQPVAIEAVKYAAYAIARRLLFLENGEPRSAAEILRFDGGKGAASGQLSADLDCGDWIARCTGELDLLMATASPEMLEIVDYKSGQGIWTADDVKTSFQLGCWYPWLVFRVYPQCDHVRVRVFNTVRNDLTPAVEFTRSKFMLETEARIRSSVQARHNWRGKPTAPTYPSAEKCVLCDHATRCPEAKGPAKDVATDPRGAYQQMIQLRIAADKIDDALAAVIDASPDGEIRVGDNTLLGRGAPKKPEKRPPIKAYEG